MVTPRYSPEDEENARFWFAHLARRKDPKAEKLEELPFQLLVGSYKIWWSEYSRVIRESPSNRRGAGVSEADTRKAVSSADLAVDAFIQAH